MDPPASFRPDLPIVSVITFDLPAGSTRNLYHSIPLVVARRMVYHMSRFSLFLAKVMAGEVGAAVIGNS